MASTSTLNPEKLICELRELNLQIGDLDQQPVQNHLWEQRGQVERKLEDFRNGKVVEWETALQNMLR